MVLAIATAGLVYELAMAAVASYVLGDSVRQFSIVIGAYLSALGLGAYLSRYVGNELALTFVKVELAAALLGGLSTPGLLIAFSLGASFEVLLLFVVVAVGTLVGIELPLLMRILERRLSFKDLVSRALTFDYAGSLVGSLAFSLYLVPKLGLVRTSIVCGLLNAAVAYTATSLLFDQPATERRPIWVARGSALIVVLMLIASLIFAPRWIATAETNTFGRVQHAEDTPYQRILLTRRDGALELYLNGHLQFSSRDECRYHEALVHPAFAYTAGSADVLIGGGGDGLALREALKWPTIRSITLVDLDPAMTDLARSHPLLSQLNRHSLQDPRVRVVNEDAFQWIKRSNRSFDVIILDFPDPTTYGVGKLFSTTFYRELRRLLSVSGTLVVQSTSPHLTPNSFWSIERTISHVGLSTRPMRVYLPSFGDWGFVLARQSPWPQRMSIPAQVDLPCLGTHGLTSLLELPKDTASHQAAVNHLDNQALVHLYLDEAKRLEQ